MEGSHFKHVEIRGVKHKAQCPKSARTTNPADRMVFRKDEVGSRVWTFNFILTEFFDHVEKLGHTTLI